MFNFSSFLFPFSPAIFLVFGFSIFKGIFFHGRLRTLGPKDVDEKMGIYFVAVKILFVVGIYLARHLSIFISTAALGIFFLSFGNLLFPLELLSLL